MHKVRPQVIVIQRLKRPSPCRSPEENAKYCSLFFRPWTLLTGDVIVPNLSSLGLPVELLYSIYESPLTQPLKMQDVCSTKQTKVAVNTAPKKYPAQQQPQRTESCETSAMACCMVAVCARLCGQQISSTTHSKFLNTDNGWNKLHARNRSGQRWSGI